MSADSFHHEVETGMNLKKNISDFKDFVNVIKRCGNAILIQPDDFISYPKGLGQVCIKLPST